MQRSYAYRSFLVNQRNSIQVIYSLVYLESPYIWLYSLIGLVAQKKKRNKWKNDDFYFDENELVILSIWFSFAINDSIWSIHLRLITMMTTLGYEQCSGTKKCEAKKKDQKENIIREISKQTCT